MQPRLICLFAVSLLLTSCVSTQARFATSEMFDAIGRLREDQVLNNISVSMDDEDAVPTHVVLTQGTASVTVNAGLGWKLPQFSQHAKATLTAARREYDPSMTDAWANQWQFLPVSSEGDLNRLRDIYRALVTEDGVCDRIEQQLLEQHFPPNTADPGAAKREVDATTAFCSSYLTARDKARQSTDEGSQNHSALKVFVLRAKENFAAARIQRFETSALLAGNPPAGSFRTFPSTGAADLDQVLEVLALGASKNCSTFLLKHPEGKWIFQDKDHAAKYGIVDVKPLGNYHNHSMLLAVGAESCLDDFVVLVQSTTAQLTTLSGIALPPISK